MKKIAIYYFSLAAIVGGSLVSCQEADLGFSAEEIAQAKFEKEYQENFERDYGKIAPGHTWGFDDKVFTQGTRSSNKSTRYKIIRQKKDINFDSQPDPENPGGAWLPAYTETYPVDPQWSWFQGCGENDLSEVIYAASNCPDVISQDEKDYVFWYLRQKPSGIDTCPLDNYFLQDLHQDPYPGSMDEELNVYGNEHCPGWGLMNNLHFDGAHFNDYNGLKQKGNSDSSPDYYVVKTAVTNPYYEDSKGTSSGFGTPRMNHYKFIYIPACTQYTNEKGETKRINYPGGFYLCFDYECIKEGNESEDRVERDYVYNDWVIKLTAGQYDTHRVFCEDLGSTFDLDFNDLVFDYVYYGPGIEVKVLALVGTLPISMSYGTQTENIKTSNTIQERVNKTYFFSGASDIKSIGITVTTVGRGTCWMENKEGRAPYMIQVPAGTAWPAEHQRIEKKYPDFSKYVTNPQEQPFFWGEFNKYPIYNPNN